MMRKRDAVFSLPKAIWRYHSLMTTGGAPDGLRPRVLLMWLCLAVFVAAIGYVTYGFLWPPETNDLPPLAWNDAIKAAIDVRVDFCRQLLSFAVILFAAVTGLILASPDSYRLSVQDKPELIMLVTTITILLASGVCGVQFLRNIEESYRLGGKTIYSGQKVYLAEVEDATANGRTPPPAHVPTIPDVYSSTIQRLLGAQLCFVTFGTVLSATTLISTHRLKGQAS